MYTKYPQLASAGCMRSSLWPHGALEQSETGLSEKSQGLVSDGVALNTLKEAAQIGFGEQPSWED